MAIRNYEPTEAGAGALRVAVAFDQRAEIDDGHGNKVGDFVEQFRQRASFLTLKGTETVQAARLAGVQPFVVTVRYSKAAAAVTMGWRARNINTGETYDITTAVARQNHDFIDFTCTSGKAT